jgi:putative transposase
VTTLSDATGLRRNYKFRMRPTSSQHVALQECLDAHRDLYNMALWQRRTSWEETKTPVTYGMQSAQLKGLRATSNRHARWSFSSQQATLRRLNRAYEAFYRRCSSGETPGYPRTKSEHRWDSVTWPSDRDGCRWRPEASCIYLQGVGQVKVTMHRSTEGRLKTLTIKREGRRWYLVLSYDNVPLQRAEPTGSQVGIDLGVKSFLTTSDGEHVGNPRFGKESAERLAYAQRVLARKKKGSGNRKAARQTVANRHRKIANKRRDFHHKLAKQLVEDHDVIAMEDLRISNMTRSSSGTVENPGTNVAAKSGLNRSILDAGWDQFANILIDKAAGAGRTVIKVNPRHTSQQCHKCGHVAAGNRITQASFRCQVCSHIAHADVNAAQNILRAGLALLVAQAA